MAMKVLTFETSSTYKQDIITSVWLAPCVFIVFLSVSFNVVLMFLSSLINSSTVGIPSDL